MRPTTALLRIVLVLCLAIQLDAWSILSRRKWIINGAAIGSCHVLLDIEMAPQAQAQAQAANLPTSYAPANSVPLSIDSLIPIVSIQQTIQAFQRDLAAVDKHKSTITQFPTWPKGLPTNEQACKAIFDAYSVPVSYKQKFVDSNAFLVYYTRGFDGTNRPNIETQDDVQDLQTKQYGARNEVWIALETAWVEYQYANKHYQDDDETVLDLQKAVDATAAALKAYLDLAPRQDYQKAKAAIQ